MQVNTFMKLELKLVLTLSFTLFLDSTYLKIDDKRVKQHENREKDGNDIDVYSSERNFRDMYERVSAECTREGVNVVLNRHDGMNLAYPSELRPWSFSPNSYFARDFTVGRPLQLCHSLPDLLESATKGGRVNLNGSVVFRPHDCAYKWYSPTEACHQMSRFAGIFFVGDSILRQALMSLFMVFTGDFVRGGNGQWLHRENQNKCLCDGQLAEALVCRKCDKLICSDTSWGDNMTISSSLSLCPLSKPFRVTGEFVFVDILKRGYTLRAPLCYEDPRPRLLLLHFGLHMKLWENKGVEMLRRFVDTLVRDRTACAYEYVTHVVWFTEEPEMQEVYDRYPEQSEQTIADYNAAISAYIQSVSQPTSRVLPADITLTFLNSTEIVRHGAYSDGMHPLTESHTIRSMYILNIMELLVSADRDN